MLGLSLKGEIEIDHKTDWFHLGYNLLGKYLWEPSLVDSGLGPRQMGVRRSSTVTSTMWRQVMQWGRNMRLREQKAGNIGSAPESWQPHGGMKPRHKCRNIPERRIREVHLRLWWLWWVAFFPKVKVAVCGPGRVPESERLQRPVPTAPPGGIIYSAFSPR